MDFLKKCSMLAVLVLLLACKKDKYEVGDTRKFLKFFGTAGMSQAYSLTETSDGFLLCGYSIQDGRNDKDILLVKTDKSGNRQWERRIETPEDEIARSLQVRGDQIVLAGMQVQSNSVKSSQAILLTLDWNGNVIKQSLIGDSLSSEEVFHVSYLSDGDLLVGGTRDSANQRNMFLARIHADTTQWQMNIGNLSDNDELNKIVELSDGDLLWTGTVQRTNERNIRCVRSSNTGVVKWAYEYDLNGQDESGRYVELTSDGNFMVVGSRGQENSTNERLLVMKINGNGFKLWESLPIEVQSGGYSIKRVSTGGFIVAGYSFVKFGDTDPLLLRLNEEGNTIWSKRFGGNRLDQGRMAIECSDGHFAMTGFVDLYLDKNNVFQLVKVDQEGELNEKK
ncbi:MAG: hypothetical protein MUF42_12760 [Cytophagaceae bacterium]|jgi:hypothetical protein|nr:hypothetical protein [Cytophagaceae bacterium]